MTQIFNHFRWPSRYIAAMLITLMPLQTATAGCSVAADGETGAEDSQARLQLTEVLESRLQARVRDSIPELIDALFEQYHDFLSDQPDAYLNRSLSEDC